LSGTEHWLLPEGIEELLPPRAARLERLRRRLLDMFQGWGYELVIPPMIEFLDSLLTGSGHDLALQTFKLIDPASGRLLGIRADMTPQAARIDAHALQREGVVRLCYLGTVVRTQADGLGGTRSPMQLGAELFGHGGTESDLEIIDLMLETLRLIGVEQVHLDLGHVGIYRALAAEAALEPVAETEFFGLLQRKALPEIRQWLAATSLPATVRQRLGALAELHGGPEVLERARSLLAGAPAAVAEALDALAGVAAAVQQCWPDIPIHFDLGELRGYAYQTGIVFAAFVPGTGREIARGGRYDSIGQIFGRARPATGFSTDLRTLIALVPDHDGGERRRRILAPAGSDPSLRARIRALREAGHVVVQALGGGGDPPHDALLEAGPDGWRLRDLD